MRLHSTRRSTFDGPSLPWKGFPLLTFVTANLNTWTCESVQAHLSVEFLHQLQRFRPWHQLDHPTSTFSPLWFSGKSLPRVEQVSFVQAHYLPHFFDQRCSLVSSPTEKQTWGVDCRKKTEVDVFGRVADYGHCANFWANWFAFRNQKLQRGSSVGEKTQSILCTSALFQRRHADRQRKDDGDKS